MKKAIALTELVVIILVILAGIGLIMLAKQGAQRLGCVGDVDICKNSYALYKQVKAKFGIVGIAPRVNCVAISPPNCDEKELKTDNAKETMHIMAENLRYCWEKTLGNENTMGEDFGASAILPRPVVEPDVDFCLVCSEFTPKVNIPSAEWADYLAKTKTPGGSKTYDQLITPVAESVWSLNYKGSFFAGVKYYIVSVSGEQTFGDKKVFIYISPDIYCGDKAPQIHYQLK